MALHAGAVVTTHRSSQHQPALHCLHRSLTLSRLVSSAPRAPPCSTLIPQYLTGLAHVCASAALPSVVSASLSLHGATGGSGQLSCLAFQRSWKAMMPSTSDEQVRREGGRGGGRGGVDLKAASDKQRGECH